jgi:glycine C-acetyltransferase
MGTLSKTIPAQGGYIAGSRELITLLRFNARGFVFSAALPPATAAAALAALELIDSEGQSRRTRLMANVT